MTRIRIETQGCITPRQHCPPGWRQAQPSKWNKSKIQISPGHRGGQLWPFPLPCFLPQLQFEGKQPLHRTVRCEGMKHRYGKYLSRYESMVPSNRKLLFKKKKIYIYICMYVCKLSRWTLDRTQQNCNGPTQKSLSLLCVYQMRHDRVWGNTWHDTDSTL